jgi:hypothetical protein
LWFYTEVENIALKFTRKHKRPQITKAILTGEKKQYWKYHNTDFKLKGTVIKNSVILAQKHSHRPNRLDDPEISPCSKSYLILTNYQKYTLREKMASLASGAVRTGYPYVKD